MTTGKIGGSVVITAAVVAAAAAFVLAFEAIAAAVGRACALLDPRVQAARRWWAEARAQA